jgi:hypothetical protein
MLIVHDSNINYKERHEMARGFFDNNKDIDSEAETARRKSFIARMERKLEFKKSVLNPNYEEDRYLIR